MMATLPIVLYHPYHQPACRTYIRPPSEFILYSATVRGCSALSDVSSNISLSPLYIPPHRR